MKYTSAEANKLLKTLQDELATVRSLEEQGKEFIAAMGEDVESVRPAYDFDATQKAIDLIDGKIRTVKHAINMFNATTTVPDFDMTIDQMLVYIPQLSRRKEKLEEMVRKLPKSRDNSYGRSSNYIEYRYLNYDVNKAKAEYDKISKLLTSAQMALDVVNTTLTMDINA